MATAFSQAQLQAALFAQQGGRVHAVIDARVVPGLAATLRKAELDGWDCLRRGALTPEQADQCAYLAELRESSPFTDWLLGVATRDHPGWGLLIMSSHALLPVRKHCRELNEVQGPEGDKRAWRWHDPEVLQLLLPSLSPGQLDEVFALGQTFVLPAAAQWQWHLLEQGQLSSTVRPVLAAA